MAAPPDAFLEAYVRSRVAIGCLDNTNALHAERDASEESVYDLFDHRLLSHELGLVNPDREIFDHVVAQLGWPAASLLLGRQPDQRRRRPRGRPSSRAGAGVAESREALARHGLDLL